MTRLSRTRILVITGILTSLGMAQNGRGTSDKHSIIIDPGGTGAFGLNVEIFAPIGQAFLAEAAVYDQLAIFTSVCNCPDVPMPEFFLTVREGIGTDGVVVATRSTIPGPGADGFLYFDFKGVHFHPGNQYTALVTVKIPPEYRAVTTGIAVSGTGDIYANGTAIIQGVPRADLDFYFRALAPSYNSN
jgi:hypothetical protein